MSTILERISNHYDQKLPFVCYRRPNDTYLRAYLCKSDSLIYTESFEEEGFVFAPFDDRKESLIFKSIDATIIEEEVSQYSSEKEQHIYRKIHPFPLEHQNLIKLGVEAIQRGEFSKVVLSRKDVLEIREFYFLEAFKKLLNSYVNAYVYVWYHPKVGLWMGATPERLVSLENNKFKTMALAGTQPYIENEDPEWGEKERQEHQYVIDYIVSQIKDPTNGIILKNFHVSETYSSKAGALLHLKADIEGEIGDFNLKNLLKTLHPTPAVCGLPKEKAKKFILDNESYDRSFYTGFLGEINVGDKTELFVNLRCAEFTQEQVLIYVGGGVTLESNPEKEWMETVAKAETMNKVLRKKPSLKN